VTHSESIGAMASALAKAQKAIKGAIKDAKNPHFNSRYANLESISDACREPLADNEIAVVQSPSTPEGGLFGMVTMFIHSSGEWLKSDMLTVQAKDAGPQAAGSCTTYLRRYQLAAMAGVAPADDDGEAAEGRSAPPSARAKQAPAVVVDKTTGEELPAGFYLLSNYFKSGEWHEVEINGYQGNGSALRLSTKLASIGEQAKRAYEEGCPVAIDFTAKRGKTGEGYLNKLTRLDGVTPALEPMSAESVPF
jgi:hypothetical protein